MIDNDRNQKIGTEDLLIGNIRTVNFSTPGTAGTLSPQSVLAVAGNIIYVQNCKGVLTFTNQNGQSLTMKNGDVKNFYYERLEITSSVASDAVTLDAGYGVIIPSGPGTSASNPAQTVVTTQEVFIGAATGAAFVATFKYECPFTHMELAGTWTGGTVILNYPDGSTAGAILRDAFGNIVSRPLPTWSGGGVAATKLPDTTASSLVLMMDTTGASSVSFQCSTGTINVFMTAAHTQDTSLNVMNQEFMMASATGFNYAVAATATDFWTMAADPTWTIRLERLKIYMTQTTVPNNLQLVKRSSLDTGGTSTTLTNVPMDSRDPATNATVKTYTANPASLGTLVGAIENFISSSTTESLIDLDFRQSPKKPTLQGGSNEQFALSNGGAAGFNGSTVSVTAYWSYYKE